MKYFDLLKEMFEEMVVKKNARLISTYYHPDFLLYTNGATMDYRAFLLSHEDYYATPIQYHVEFDHETFLEDKERVAGRVWITTTKPNQTPTQIEVMLIAQFKSDKIYRLWELTYPDWSQLPEFM